MSYLWAWWRPKDKRSAQPAYNKCDIGHIVIGHDLLNDYERFIEPLDVSVELEARNSSSASIAVKEDVRMRNQGQEVG